MIRTRHDTHNLHGSTLLHVSISVRRIHRSIRTQEPYCSHFVLVIVMNGGQLIYGRYDQYRYRISLYYSTSRVVVWMWWDHDDVTCSNVHAKIIQYYLFSNKNSFDFDSMCSGCGERSRVLLTFVRFFWLHSSDILCAITNDFIEKRGRADSNVKPTKEPKKAVWVLCVVCVWNMSELILWIAIINNVLFRQYNMVHSHTISYNWKPTKWRMYWLSLVRRRLAPFCFSSAIIVIICFRHEFVEFMRLSLIWFFDGNAGVNSNTDAAVTVTAIAVGACAIVENRKASTSPTATANTRTAYRWLRIRT